MPYAVIDAAIAEVAPALAYAIPEDAVAHPQGKSLKSMRDRLILELGNRNDIPVPMWNEWINDGYVDFYSSLKLPEAQKSYDQVMVVGQPYYNLPLAVDEIQSISATDPMFANTGGTMENVDIQSYRKFPIRSGDPETWFLERRVLVFWPTPSKTFTVTVDVTLLPSKLVLDTDYPALDDKWHEPLFKAAKYRAWEGVQNDVKAQLTNNEMSKLVQRKVARSDDAEDTEYPALRPIFSRRDLLSFRRHQRGRNH